MAKRMEMRKKKRSRKLRWENRECLEEQPTCPFRYRSLPNITKIHNVPALQFAGKWKWKQNEPK